MSPLERAARAAFAEVDLTKRPWESQSEHYRLDCYRMVRAALEALMEPDEAMKRSGGVCIGDDYLRVSNEAEASDVWQAMLREVLKDKP